uniref:Transmembrane protein 267 n=1 Tax=Caligus rogercresseyi TaxID=217165 RepID=C1BQ44_CALRO|nr:C5orf28 homolog [Caligus rogercresseyi]
MKHIIGRQGIFCGFVSLVIILACLCGDYLTLTYFNSRLGRALADSLTHGTIAGLSWYGVQVFLREPFSLEEVIASVVIGSAIDIDHFIEGGSLSLQAAISLPHRPFLHNSLIPMSLWALSLMLATVMRRSKYLRVGSLFGLAFMSHHIRDAWRRGLWLGPLGSMSVSYHGYLLALALEPLALGALLNFLTKEVKIQSYSGHEIV